MAFRMMYNLKPLLCFLAFASLVVALVLEGLSTENYPKNPSDQDMQKSINVAKYHNWALVLAVLSVSFGVMALGWKKSGST